MKHFLCLIFILILRGYYNVIFSQSFNNGSSIPDKTSSVHNEVLRNKENYVYEALSFDSELDLSDLGANKILKSNGLTDIGLIKLDSNNLLQWVIKIGGKYGDGQANILHLAEADSGGVYMVSTVSLIDSVVFYNADESVAETFYKSKFQNSVTYVSFCIKVRSSGQINWVIPFSSEMVDTSTLHYATPTSIKSNSNSDLVLSLFSYYNIVIKDNNGTDTIIYNTGSLQKFPIILQIDKNGKVKIKKLITTKNNWSELIDTRVIKLDNDGSFVVEGFTNVYQNDTFNCLSKTFASIGFNSYIARYDAAVSNWSWVRLLTHDPNFNEDMHAWGTRATIVTNEEAWFSISLNKDIEVYDSEGVNPQLYSPNNQSRDVILMRFDENFKIKAVKYIGGIKDEYVYCGDKGLSLYWFGLSTNGNDLMLDGYSINSVNNTHNYFLIGFDSLLSVKKVLILPYNYSIPFGTKSILADSSNSLSVFGTYSIHDLYLGCKTIALTGVKNCAIINNKTIYKDTSITFCGNYKPKFGAIPYSQSGIYFDTLFVNVGCDEITRINFTQLQTTAEIYDTICSYYQSPSRKYLYGYSGTYMDTIKNSIGCESILTLHLIINRPQISHLISNDINCDQPNAIIQLDGAASYVWTPKFYLNTDTGYQVISTPPKNIQYIIKAVGTDTSCWSLDTLNINTNFTHPINQLPNVFTPNSDGVNDCLSADMICKFNNVDFWIFNRWGNIVKHISNDGDCWGGESNNQNLPEGVYLYIIDGNSYCDIPIKQEGIITLIRQ